jgi:hypothetical protein
MQSILDSAVPGQRRTLGTVIVTGGASGLGRAIAAAVGTAGGTPVTFDINEAREASDHRRVDCGDRRTIEAAVADVAATYGAIDAVRVKAMTVAPSAFAIWIATCPRPPMPTMPIVSPLPILKCFSGENVVTPEHKSGAADFGSIPVGIRSTKSSLL